MTTLRVKQFARILIKRCKTFIRINIKRLWKLIQKKKKEKCLNVITSRTVTIFPVMHSVCLCQSDVRPRNNETDGLPLDRIIPRTDVKPMKS